MKQFPLIEIIVFFSRFEWLKQPVWRTEHTKHIKQVRSRHTKHDGGVVKSYFNLETKEGEIYNVVFDHEELVWECEQPEIKLDRMLAHIKRHKHVPSLAHRIEPIRFEITPNNESHSTDKPIVDRLTPFRFILGKNTPYQVHNIETKHIENLMVTKHLHYVTETTERRFFHVVFIPDQLDWRMMQEVDEQYLFVR